MHFCSISNLNLEATNVDEAVTVQGENEDGIMTLKESSGEIELLNSSKGELQ